MKKLPLGIQNFREIVEENHVYVDKTKYVYDLINSGKCFFLSRPRRFGKSLFLDTIAEVFKGNKELFKGLWIYDSDYEFKSYPIVRIDMSGVNTASPDLFISSLLASMQFYISRENIHINHDDPSVLLSGYIKELHNKYFTKVVVLIDEYDKPILDNIEDIEIAEANRTILRSFYGVLKSLDPYLKFTFLTGVSKFAKTSVFSSLNNLSDITMNENYANICGVPVNDLETYFRDRIESLADHEHYKTYENMRDRILFWYDGYSWDGKTKLLNPYGLLSFFFARNFKSFWYVSGSPKFLIELLKSRPEDVPKLKNMTISEADMDVIDIQSLGIGSLFFQTGYLTLKEIITYPDASPDYLLEIPNHEVKEAFFKHITAGLAERTYDFASGVFREIRKALRTGDLQGILTVLKSLFAAIPYQLNVNSEAYFHSIFFCIMNVLGFNIDAEVSVSGGRIDAALELADKAYIFEFKYETCEPDADDGKKRKIFEKTLTRGMKQLSDRGYADKYKGSGKTVYIAVFAFLGRDNIEMKSQVL